MDIVNLKDRKSLDTLLGFPMLNTSLLNGLDVKLGEWVDSNVRCDTFVFKKILAEPWYSERGEAYLALWNNTSEFLESKGYEQIDSLKDGCVVAYYQKKKIYSHDEMDLMLNDQTKPLSGNIVYSIESCYIDDGLPLKNTKHFSVCNGGHLLSKMGKLDYVIIHPLDVVPMAYGNYAEFFVKKHKM